MMTIPLKMTLLMMEMMTPVTNPAIRSFFLLWGATIAAN